VMRSRAWVCPKSLARTVRTRCLAQAIKTLPQHPSGRRSSVRFDRCGTARVQLGARAADQLEQTPLDVDMDVLQFAGESIPPASARMRRALRG
jgi:hypothetical protein